MIQKVHRHVFTVMNISAATYNALTYLGNSGYFDTEYLDTEEEISHFIDIGCLHNPLQYYYDSKTTQTCFGSSECLYKDI